VAVAALLIVVVAAGGSSPVTLVNRMGDRQPQNHESAVEVPIPQDLPDVVALPFTLYLLFLVALVLFGLIGLVLALEIPRWRRRRGVRGVEIEDFSVGGAGSVRQRVEKALQEFTAHPHRPPRDAVIAAWLALEEAEQRLPHQTPTEFTERLGVDATVLRNLYQRARFGHEEVTGAQAAEARRELDRIVRELA
jgi:hypothetical protein